MKTQYVEQARKGDHICYISDLRKLRAHYPGWRIAMPLDTIIDELIEFEQHALRAQGADRRAPLVIRRAWIEARCCVAERSIL